MTLHCDLYASLLSLCHDGGLTAQIDTSPVRLIDLRNLGDVRQANEDFPQVRCGQYMDRQLNRPRVVSNSKWGMPVEKVPEMCKSQSLQQCNIPVSAVYGMMASFSSFGPNC